MKRRRVLVAFGSAAIGGATAVGTGAFSSVRAERSISVAVKDDDRALLKLDELGGGFRSTSGGGEVQFLFPGPNEEAEGLGTDSVYEFDDDSDADASDEGLLRISNKGTQPVDVFARHESSSAIKIELYNVENKNAITKQSPVNLVPVESDTGGTGGSVTVGVRINTFGASVGNFENEVIEIVAKKYQNN